METCRIGVVGCAGRMGRAVVRVVQESDQCEIVGGCARPGSQAIGRDIGEMLGAPAMGVLISADPAQVVAKADSIIDFSVPPASVALAELAAQARIGYVIGTTGLSAEHQEALGRAARHTAIVQAANMSIGVTLLSALAEQVARILSPDYDIEIVEMHHRHKADAPSGTALELGRAAARGRGVNFDEVARRARDGRIGPRPHDEIGFAVLRGGDVAGDHSIIFAGEGERVALTHSASTREVFAKGAVTAALWARNKPPGLYSMKDVLGIS